MYIYLQYNVKTIYSIIYYDKNKLKYESRSWFYSDMYFLFYENLYNLSFVSNLTQCFINFLYNQNFLFKNFYFKILIIYFNKHFIELYISFYSLIFEIIFHNIDCDSPYHIFTQMLLSKFFSNPIFKMFHELMLQAKCFCLPF